MSVDLEEYPVAKKESKYTVTKIGTNLLRDARIVCSITGEALQDYLTRVMEPIVARDKEQAFERERTAKEQAKPKKKAPPDR
jgi:hypothetical protein